MIKHRLLILLSLLIFFGCKPLSLKAPLSLEFTSSAYAKNKGPLLATHFKSLEELKAVVQIEYTKPGGWIGKKAQVKLTHVGGEEKVTSILKEGISDLDIKRAGYGGIWKRLLLCLKSPYLLMVKDDLVRVFSLGRRRGELYGGGDVAFYDLAENMVANISDEDMEHVPSNDLSEKGYINTFNHVTAQAFMTTLFSEKFTDFAADTHERGNMPELITGKFTTKQLADVQRGPVDNYIDLVNNEWGQELGKELQEKYKITRRTDWTEALLTDYLNDVQSYYSWTLGVSFEPFRADEILIRRFTQKLNMIMREVPTRHRDKLISAPLR